jgi:chromosome segregation protein
VLEQAEKSLTGYADGARFLLEAARQARLSGTRGALSAALDVPAGLETAIAAVLGESLDAVLLDRNETENALGLLDTGEAGRAELLPTEPLREMPSLTSPGDPDCLGVALDLISVPVELRSAVNILLGQVLVVRDRAAARRVLPGLAAPARVVTLRGEVFHADGRIMAGRIARTATLSRPRQIREYDLALNGLRRAGRLQQIWATPRSRGRRAAYGGGSGRRACS